MKKTTGIIVLGVTFLAGVISAQAATANFTGGGGNTLWHDPANWDTGEVPGFTQNDVAFLSNNITVDLNADSWSYFVNNAMLTSGASGQYRGMTRFLAGDGFGTETQTITLDFGDGNVLLTTGNNRHTLGSRSGQTSILNIQSGTTIFESNPLDIGDGTGSSGTLNLSGGEFIIGRNPINVGDLGTALVDITGGIFKTRAELTVGSLGTFRVAGTGATEIGIGSQSSVDGSWTQSGVLSVSIDETVAGITQILVDDYLDDGGGTEGNVTFNAGALLDVDFMGAQNLGTFTVMEWEGIVTGANNLAFAAGVDQSVWSFNVDETNKMLTVTAIPEPSTLVLIALSSIGLIALRRFRR